MGQRLSKSKLSGQALLTPLGLGCTGQAHACAHSPSTSLRRPLVAPRPAFPDANTTRRGQGTPIKRGLLAQRPVPGCLGAHRRRLFTQSCIKHLLNADCIPHSVPGTGRTVVNEASHPCSSGVANSSRPGTDTLLCTHTRE